MEDPEGYWRRIDPVEREYGLTRDGVLDLPIAELIEKLGFCEEREQTRQRELINGWYVNAKTIWFSQKTDKDTPPRSKEEAERKTNWAKVGKYADWLEEQKFLWEYQALQSEKHLAAVLGYSHVMGEPEDLMTYEEFKRAEKERVARIPEEARSNLIDLMQRAAERGAAFGPADG